MGPADIARTMANANAAKQSGGAGLGSFPKAQGHSQRFKGPGVYGRAPSVPGLKAVGHSQRFTGAGNYRKLAQKMAGSGTGTTSGGG